jgi:hypothetical protein
MIEDNAWRDAFKSLIGDDSDPKPLAGMLLSPSAIPNWARQELAELLDPIRPLLMGDPSPDPSGACSKRALLDLKNADRLVFTRTPATARKIRTFEKRVAAGLAVLDAKAAGKSHADAVAEVVEKIGSENGDDSYVNHSVKAGRDLPPFYKALARKAAAQKK